MIGRNVHFLKEQNIFEITKMSIKINGITLVKTLQNYL